MRAIAIALPFLDHRPFHRRGRRKTGRDGYRTVFSVGTGHCFQNFNHMSGMFGAAPVRAFFQDGLNQLLNASAPGYARWSLADRRDRLVWLAVGCYLHRSVEQEPVGEKERAEI